MSRLPLAEPDALPPYLKAIHDATPEENWLGRHFAQTLRVWVKHGGLSLRDKPGAFAPAPDLA